MNECRKIYQFLDYFHDHPKRANVKLEDPKRQPPKSTMDAIFHKMKADYLRYIWECLSGDDSILEQFK